MIVDLPGVFNQQTAASLTEYTFWGTSAVGTAETGDVATVVLGTKFYTDRNGVIRGIRWQRQSGTNGVTHVALFQGTTNLSGTTTVSGQTTSGWQRQDFSSPVSITSGTLYIAAALYSNGGYYATNYFFTSALTVGPITAVATSESDNGLYVYSSTMVVPNSVFESACYYIDPVFAA